MNKRWIGVTLALALLAAGSAAAQDRKREAQLRNVHGTVVDKQENPVVSGLVYLKNLRTLMVKTHITDDGGRYHFSGLDPNVDYEIHAEYGDSVSAKRTISSLDSRKEIVLTLRLDKKKSGK